MPKIIQLLLTSLLITSIYQIPTTKGNTQNNLQRESNSKTNETPIKNPKQKEENPPYLFEEYVLEEKPKPQDASEMEMPVEVRQNFQKDEQYNQDQIFKMEEKLAKQKKENSSYDSSETTKLELNKPTLISNSLYFENTEALKENEYFILTIEGHTRFDLLINTKVEKGLPKRTIAANSENCPTVIPISQKYYPSTGKIIMVPTVKIMDNSKVTLTKGDSFSIDFNSCNRIISIYANTIQARVKNPHKQITIGKKNRLQFRVETDIFQMGLSPNESLDMFINLNGEFPDMMDYSLSSTGHIQSGLIKTVNSESDYYCVKEGCEYEVTILQEKIETFNFSPAISLTNIEQKVDFFFSKVEELEKGEEITYKYLVDKSDGKGDITFMLSPVFNDPDMYINPDSRPTNLKDYRYNIQNKGREQIFISASETKQVGFTGEVFFVTYRCSDQNQVCTFQIDVQRFKPGNSIGIGENTTNMAKLIPGELLNHFMILKSDQIQTFNIDFSLTIDSPDVAMIVKECKMGEGVCTVEKEDIQNANIEQRGNEPGKRILKFVKSENFNKNSNNTINALVDFNCTGYDSPEDKKVKFSNSFPVSSSCNFAIGVFAKETIDKEKGRYLLNITGQNIMKSYRLQETIPFQVKGGDIVNFKLKVDKNFLQNFEEVLFKVISISGKFKMYFSATTENPNRYDFDNYIEAFDFGTSGFHTQTNFSSIRSDKLKDKEFIFAAIHAEDFTIMEFYADYINSEDDDGELVQKLIENNIIHSTISFQGRRNSYKGLIFSQEFIFQIPPYNYGKEFLEVTVNSNILGLSICVQTNTTQFDFDKECDNMTNNNVLSISEFFHQKNAGEKIAISVQKFVDPNEKGISLPIEFSILVSYGNKVDGVKLIAPGQSFSKLLKARSEVIYQLNLSHMENYALIMLTSDHTSIKAYITNKEGEFDTPITVLSQQEFAMEISNPGRFKDKYCFDDLCELFIKVVNNSQYDNRFAVTYTIDNVPIYLKEGSEIQVTSNRPLYFITEANTNKPLMLNIYNDQRKMVVFSKLFGTNEIRRTKLPALLSEEQFDFKSEVENDVEIFQTPADLKKFSPCYVGFYYKPDSSFEDIDTSVDFNIYDGHDKSRVRLDSNISKLQPDSHVTNTIKEGAFSYYYATVDAVEGFSVFLSIISGEADLYINPGLFNFTTTDFYWKKSTTFKGDELVITPDLFEKPEDVVDVYTIGVYGKELAEYSILFSPNFDSLIKLKYQQLITINLKAGVYYYFDFYNKHKTFSSYFYTEEKGVEVSLLNYDENKNQEFYEMITNPANFDQKQTYNIGHIGLTDLFIENDKVKTHYVIRVKSLYVDSKSNILIYDKDKPIKAYANKRFSFTQVQNETREFKISLKKDFNQINIDVKLEFGDMDFIVSAGEESNEQTFNLNKPSQKYIEYNVKDTTGAITVFSEVIITIKTKKESSYSILVKPDKSFKEIRPYRTELIYTSPTKDQYLYFILDDNIVNPSNYLSLDFYHVDYYNDSPEFLFLSESDMVLSKDSEFLPMPLIDIIENDLGEFKHTEVIPEIRAGYYIIKINKAPTIMPIKISLSVNGIKAVELNGLYRKNIEKNKMKIVNYFMYVPEPGEFRFILETCSDAEITTTSFEANDGGSIVSYDNNYDQVYQYINIDKTKNTEEKEQKDVTYTVRSGVVDEKGLVGFKVQSSGKSLVGKNNSSLNYYLITEFRNKSRELFLKDYIDVFTDKEDLNNSSFDLSFIKGNEELSVKVDLPKFKDQLFQDFPNLKSAEIKVYFYLMKYEKSFEDKFKKCGISAVNTVKTKSRINQKTASVQQMKENKLQGEISFSEKDLVNFDEAYELALFSHVEYYFFENQEDEFNIGLDVKFADIPFFLVKFENGFNAKGRLWRKISIVLIICFIGFILVCFFKRMRENRNEREVISLDIEQRRQVEDKEMEVISRDNSVHK